MIDVLPLSKKLTEQKAAIYSEYQEIYKELEALRNKRNLIKYGPDAMVPNEFSEANIELAKQINKELHKVIKKGQATEEQKAEFNKNAELISDYSKYSTFRENYVDTEQKVQLLNTLSRLAEVEYNYIMNSGLYRVC